MNGEIIFLEMAPSGEDYNSLRNSVGWEMIEGEGVGLALKSSLYVLSVMKDSHIIGMGRVLGDGKLVFYIQDLIVLPEFQNRKIGYLLMEKLMNYIKENAVDGAFVGLMSAKGKERFYEKFGFLIRPNDFLGSGMTRLIHED
ncbi:GNAT family N-acetyltransferase [Moheibacter sp.]|jgi:ribosomal protein S18 acetylase RimI-like enzyme|uniref:GNAT family N-acetyltransferase n=1 Tax=Moheibacter sp. TaxID=1965316 RepID=UPI00168EBCFE|nr:GNAT family N-acetyltransferase [Flavobacteriaceae bacterium]